MSSPALHDATVVIVGLGLMGGSLGMALDERCARRIGVDIDGAAGPAAVAAGAVDEHRALDDAVRDADLVVLAVPAGAAAGLVPDVVRTMRSDAVLTDLASTKRMVCDAMDRVEGPATIGGHPMCGRELAGIGAADAALFEGARWVLVPTATVSGDARRIVGELIDAVGAEPLELGREAHDRAVATASHLPYAFAQVLVGALADANGRTEGIAGSLAATGFRSGTRLAGGDVAMWRDILTSNAGYVREAIDVSRLLLAELADALDDPVELERLLSAGRATHAPYRSTT